MDPRLDVSELRSQIAKIDEEIRERLDARARLSSAIHARLEAEPVTIDVGEREWLDRLVQGSSGDMPEASLRAIFSQIRAAARAIEQPVRVAYLGPEGAFCHQFARGYFGVTGTLIECADVSDALEEVARGRAAFAAFPFESSVEGLVQTSVTALAATDLVIVAERTLPAVYQLMAKRTALSDIEKVYATPTAHAWCQRFLDKELPRVVVIDVRSAVVAAELAAEDPTSAAIVPEPCGRERELEIVRGNVGDVADVKVRYALASTRPAMRSGNDLTCMLFSVDDSPGALFDVLRHFAERGINLKRLHSRPVQREPWNYVFYVEIGGHLTERPVITALEAVKRSTKYLKVLGSFPVTTS